MNIKNFIFKHIEKLGFGIALCYLIYTAVHTFVILNMEVNRTDTKLLSLSSTVERKSKTSVPPVLDTELKNAGQLALRLTLPPPASPLPRPYIFGKFTKERTVSDITTRDLLKKPELQPADRLGNITPSEMEFVFKGGTADMALVQVRKLYKDKWWTESFTMEKGEAIGKKKLMGKETVNFDTDCRLIEIVPQAQKPLVIKKTTVVQNEKGEFLGSSFTEETHMISASKIIFEDKKGESYDLWIGELVKLGTDTVTVYPLTNISSAN
ncbi:MAG: hypothetical protein HYV59_15690 [Planctomycetes bacterium]|nr:hypothetical protein [Planctomycetota bacterium]